MANIPETQKERVANKITARMISLVTKKEPLFLKDCEFRAVQTLPEFRVCCQLVYQEYLLQRYSRPNRARLRISVHQMTDNSTTYIALYKKKYVLGSMTLVQDNPMGVPMDKIYHEELNELRRQQKHFCEATMLAQNSRILSHPSVPKFFRTLILLNLFKAAIRDLKASSDRNTLVACFHPNHEIFYRGLKFQPLGGLKTYSHVQENPAVGFMLDLNFPGTDKDSQNLKKILDVSKDARFSQNLPTKIKFNLHDIGKMLIEASEEEIENRIDGRI